MIQPMKASVFLFWDYDTQWGGDRSRAAGGRKTWGHLEFENTERLLEILGEHEMPSCFAVVGAAALPGERPYHDPDQIRAIHAAGHEVASHTFHHDWLPGLNQRELTETLTKSKDSLEQCIGAEVRSFVPPFNQPFDFPARLSFSLSERRTAGPDRTDQRRLCETLYKVGYRFCRVGYRPLQRRIAEKVLRRKLPTPSHVEQVEGVTCLRTNAGGFDSAVTLLQRCIDERKILVVYGHPHSCSDPTSPQRFGALERFLQIVDEQRRQDNIRCLLPRDILQESVHE